LGSLRGRDGGDDASAGYSEDEEEEEAICDRMAGLTRDVAHTPATTLPGLMFKAMAAAFVSDPAGDTLLGRAEQAFADGYEMSDAGVGRGIIRDLSGSPGRRPMVDFLARRGFLRQLAGLPLIGGGVTLLATRPGRPSP
jgi:hypothetical protein